ncbi:reticulon-3 isoform X3 [Trichomycterus rosablanca]|uniref:reticulon-3 isoform X3 n=1 Tax=Trichomycterus rosablanca TaxID=2290929 RepID=UPI002F354177
MADPMTQSHQISSSQGLNDGHSKDSKFSDSFFSSSPVSLIKSPQDKRVALDSDKPSDVLSTSLRFSSQQSSFSSVTYGNESAGPPSNRDRSFREKRELFESTISSQNQDSTPIKVSPVSERIKALEALAAKKNDSDWTDGGFHFRERNNEKSPTEQQGISYRSSIKKKPPSTEQDSPESPFEILGGSRRGSDFEDTADWMRAHLPPAPNFNLGEADFDEKEESFIKEESPPKETKNKDMRTTNISESFVGVPAEFMDTPVEVEANQINDDANQSRQDSVENESAFDLRFLPTAYIYDHQEKSDIEAHDPPCLPETQVSEVTVSPAPPDDFKSPSLVSSAPVSQTVPNAIEESGILGVGDPPEILEVDSSGESDDTVIEDSDGVSHAAGTDAPDCTSSTNIEALPQRQEKPIMQVPIINVIETEEQVFSDYEVEEEEEEEDEQRYQITHEPTSEASLPSEDNSDVSKSITEETLPKATILADSDADYSPGPKIVSDEAEEDAINQICLDSKSLNLENSQAESPVSPNTNSASGESTMNSVKSDKTEEFVNDLSGPKDLLNEVESSDIDTYLDHYSSEEQALKDQLNSGLFTENIGETNEQMKSNFVQDSWESTMYDQQSYDKVAINEFDEMYIESKSNSNSFPEPSSAGISITEEVQVEPLVLQNKIPSLELEEPCLDQETITSSEEGNYVTQSVEEETAPALFPSFHNDATDRITEVMSDFVGSDLTKILVMTNSEQDELIQCNAPDSELLPEISNPPESTEPESSTIAATDSFVEFMRECLKSQQDEDSKSLDPGHISQQPIPVTSSSSATVIDLEQEHLTINALKELGSSQDKDEISVPNKDVPVSLKAEPSQPLSKHGTIHTSQRLLNESQPDASLTEEVEAIDVWVAEAYHLAEHVLTLLLTHLSVRDLVYWRDPKKSGVVFGTSLLLLLSLAAFSVISVLSYLLLALLCVTISFRVYKAVVQAVQKTSDGHPFKQLMEKDVSLSPEGFRKHVDGGLTYVNRGLKQMIRLFLVEDLVDSLKLAVLMWLLTYVGAVFNGITILILVDILAFTVPPLYEKYKTQIDRYIDIARTQFNNVVAKVQEKLHKGKRTKAE